MSKCPYTWFKGLFGGAPSAAAADPNRPAKHLMVRVVRDGEERVMVALPAKSARWLIEVIPDHVVQQIRAEEIPIDDIGLDLSGQAVLYPRPVFSLVQPHRNVQVWLE